MADPPRPTKIAKAPTRITKKLSGQQPQSPKPGGARRGLIGSNPERKIDESLSKL